MTYSVRIAKHYLLSVFILLVATCTAQMRFPPGIKARPNKRSSRSSSA
ncbi:hypothetical protein ABIA24_005224 [Sinorhizobium fredii]